jgi:hypothetical protein
MKDSVLNNDFKELCQSITSKLDDTGVIGRAIEKFFVFNGAGRNGKGFLNEFMKVLLGDYFEYVSPIILTEDPKKKSSAQANPEMAKLSKRDMLYARNPRKINLFITM